LSRRVASCIHAIDATLLDGVEVPVAHRSTSQHGRVLVEKGLRVKNYRAPGSVVDLITGRRSSKSTHRWARDLGQDIAALRQDRLCLVTLCTDEELARDSPGFQARVAAEVACREPYPIQDKRRPDDTRAFDELIARLVDRINDDMRVIIHCNGGMGRSALVAAAVLIGLSDMSAGTAVACVRAARPGSLRNPLQLWFLRSFARRWKSASKKSIKPPIPNPSDMFRSKRASDSYVRCLAANTS